MTRIAGIPLLFEQDAWHDPQRGDTASHYAFSTAVTVALVDGIEALDWVRRLLPDEPKDNPIRDRITATLDAYYEARDAFYAARRAEGE